MSHCLRTIAALVFCLALVSSRPALAGDERQALVIGNSAYTGAPELKNPVNDAKLMAKTLGDVGFKVTLLTDANQKEMHKALVQFSRSLRSTQGSVGLLYYAGHGVQVNGVNYMLPVSADIKDESEVPVEGLDVNSFLGTMESSGSKLNIIILDACRNNPFARSFRSATAGLAQIQAASGMMIAYSTAPGQVAFDGEGLNSPYTMALDRFIRQAGATVETVFKRVLAEVEDATEKKQVPWVSSSFRGDFYFVAKGKETEVADASDNGSASAALEQLFWESIVNSTNPASFDAYLTAFPNGVFAQLAKVKIAELSSQQVASLDTGTSDTVVRSTGAGVAGPSADDQPRESTRSGPSAPDTAGEKEEEPDRRPWLSTRRPYSRPMPVDRTQWHRPSKLESNALEYKYLFADSDTRELADADVQDLECRKLWRARNEMYYRKGYCFKSEWGIRFFDNSNCSAAVVNMTGVEARNVRTIRTWEIRKNCRATNLFD